MLRLICSVPVKWIPSKHIQFSSVTVCLIWTSELSCLCVFMCVCVWQKACSPEWPSAHTRGLVCAQQLLSIILQVHREQYCTTLQPGHTAVRHTHTLGQIRFVFHQGRVPHFVWCQKVQHRNRINGTGMILYPFISRSRPNLIFRRSKCRCYTDAVMCRIQTKIMLPHYVSIFSVVFKSTDMDLQEAAVSWGGECGKMVTGRSFIQRIYSWPFYRVTSHLCTIYSNDFTMKSACFKLLVTHSPKS